MALTNKKELVRFLVAGFSAVGTDMAVYYILLHIYPHSVAKAISFLAGSFVAYVINKYWTFKKHELSIFEITKFTILYASTLIINVAVNKASLLVFPRYIFLAFLIATGMSTVLNFVGQKWWVFK